MRMAAPDHRAADEREMMSMRFLFAVALSAAAAAAGAAPRHAGPKSPNDMICRELPVTGSRLDVQRVCMTRLQWEEQRRDARDATDRAQTRQNNPQG
jgi:hypothetical protein